MSTGEGLEAAVRGAETVVHSAKRAAERLVAESGIPWTTLRATQFHDWILMTLRQFAKLPVGLPTWSGVRFQPVGTAAAFREGADLAPGRATGRRTWEDFLAARAGQDL
ncbi:hypothetical protein [Nonomuraea sp. NPDC050691]|uniref:hypothetical protein n=1 Tax=Nonomuraea sp. NPDC050691 TaxID=3155661 RepID=UPI0033DECA67